MEYFQKFGQTLISAPYMACKLKNVSLQKFSLTLKILV